MQPASDGELVVLSWGGPWDRALRSAVSDPFEAATGIAVRHRRYVGLSIPDEVGSAVREGERPPIRFDDPHRDPWISEALGRVLDIGSSPPSDDLG